MSKSILKKCMELQTCTLRRQFTFGYLPQSNISKRFNTETVDGTTEAYIDSNKNNFLNDDTGITDKTTNKSDKEKTLKASSSTSGDTDDRGPPPEAPTNCCMSSCPNCVWIDYAEEMSQYYTNGSAMAEEEIKKIEDPSLQSYLLLELKLKKR